MINAPVKEKTQTTQEITIQEIIRQLEAKPDFRWQLYDAFERPVINLTSEHS